MHRALLAALLLSAIAGTAHAQQPPQQPPPNGGQWQPPPDAPPAGTQQPPPHGATPPPPAGAQQPPPHGVAPPAGAQQVPPGAQNAAPAQNGALGAAPQNQVAAVPQAPPAPAPHIAFPVVVVAWPDRSVAQPINDAIRTAVVETLAPAARGRPTVALADPARLPPVLACNGDATCIGGKLAELQAIAGVLVHVTRRNRTSAIDVRVEVVDPVSGAQRHEPVTGQVPYAQEASPAAAVAALLQPLLGTMPAPPPPPTLLVAVNVDGAQITVDGQPFGESPAPPAEVPAGRHNVVVARRGWATGNRMVNILDTGSSRVDFDLEPSAATLAALETGRVHDTGGGGGHDEGDHATSEQPWYTQWYVLGAAGLVVVGIIIAVAAVAASGTDMLPPVGIGVPSIH